MDERMETTETVEKKGKGLLIAAIVVGAIAVLYLALCAYAYFSPKIYPNTYLAGINYGGLTAEQAERRFAAAATMGKDATVTFGLADGTVIAQLQPDVAVDAAAAGRSLVLAGGSQDGFFDGGINYLAALIGEGERVYHNGDDAALMPLVDEVFAALACETVEFAGEMTETGITFTRAQDGRVVRDNEQSREDILVALRHALYSGSDTFVGLEDGEHYDLSPAKTVDLAAFRRSVIGGTTNAYYDIANETIVPETMGVTMTLDELTAAYNAAEPGATVSFEVQVNRPEVTAAMLEECMFRDKLASWTTYAYGPAGRQTNVRLAAEKCNGVILNAGDIFDYSKTLGPVTAGTGYQPAPGYLRGKTVDMTGGGICQVTSTIYVAALHANLEIVERTAHGFASSYVGLGLDATVADNGPQFRMRNNTLYPIKIETSYSASNNITVTIWGTKTDDTYVKMESEVLETIPYGEVFEETDTLAPGEKKVEQDPYTGYRVNTYRCVYAGDGTLISRTFEAYSRYKARDRITLVGKAVEAPAELPAETPSAETVETPEATAPAEP